jgi:hypothetical protein
VANKFNVYAKVLLTGFCLPFILAGMSDLISPTYQIISGFEEISRVVNWGLWPAVIICTTVESFYTADGFKYLMISALVNMILYLCICAGIYVSKKVKTPDAKPLVIIASYISGVIATLAFAIIVMVSGMGRLH